MATASPGLVVGDQPLITAVPVVVDSWPAAWVSIAAAISTLDASEAVTSALLHGGM